jgi:hypothetical protein
MQVTDSTTENLGSTNFKKWCSSFTVSCYSENGIPKVSHQAYADNGAKHLLSLHFLLNVSRSHQCFDFLNILRSIYTMGIVVHFDHLQLRNANGNKNQCSRRISTTDGESVTCYATHKKIMLLHTLENRTSSSWTNQTNSIRAVKKPALSIS